MKKIKLTCTALMMCFAAAASAQDQFDLSKLDVLGTCKIGTSQEKNAELALSSTKALFTWHVGDLYAALHPEFIGWHSALSELLVSFPAYRDKVPFKSGQFNKEGLLPTMSFIAYSNDSEAYKADIKRVDCIGDDKVIIVAEFFSEQIQRNETNGCVTHKVAYQSPLKLVVQMRSSPTNAKRTLVYRFDTHVDERETVKARIALAQKVKTEPALPADPAKCKTREDIYKEFKAQIN